MAPRSPLQGGLESHVLLPPDYTRQDPEVESLLCLPKVTSVEAREALAGAHTNSEQTKLLLPDT